jgi:hypothetical protein
MKPRRIRTVNRRGRKAAPVGTGATPFVAEPSFSRPKSRLNQPKK